MLALYFKAARGALMGPSAAWVMFDKGQLLIADRPTPIASYSTRGWTYQGVEYPEIECRAFLFVETLSRDTQVDQRIGPRPVLRVRNTHLFAGRQLVATYDARRGLWMSSDHKAAWAAIRVLPADSTITRPLGP